MYILNLFGLKLAFFYIHILISGPPSKALFFILRVSTIAVQTLKLLPALENYVAFFLSMSLDCGRKLEETTQTQVEKLTLS